MAELSQAGRSIGLETVSASTRPSASRSGTRAGGSGVTWSRITRAAWAGVRAGTASGREDLRPVPGERRQVHEPARVGEAEHGEWSPEIAIVGDERDPFRGVVLRRVE